MPTERPRPWRRDSLFGDGLRIPLDRERRAQWRARLTLWRRARGITAHYALVGEALLRRLGPDGRCDPSHATLAADAGVSESTVKRALAAFLASGLVVWVRRLVRSGWRVEQTSNAYALSLGSAPPMPAIRPKPTGGQTDRQTLKKVFSLVAREQREAQEALKRVASRRQAALWPQKQEG